MGIFLHFPLGARTKSVAALCKQGEAMAGVAAPPPTVIPWVHVVTQPVSVQEPTQKDMAANDSLIQVMMAEKLIPSEEESAARVKALGKLNELVAAFVRQAFEKNGHGDAYNDVTSFRLRTFGSYRLDVHLPGADMDTVMVVPKHVLRSDMFTILYPTMQKHKDIKNIIAVEEARVPVIKFEMDDFEFDLAMARIEGLSALPEEFDVTDDRYLKHVGTDMQSITSLNGVRVTDTIRNLVPTMDTLKYCIRALKLWAKRRGVYKNVLGFLGGISIEIMAARIGQMYPKALPSKLLYYFFVEYSQWKWPQPLGLTPINVSSCELTLPVWCTGSTEATDRRHVMPIITPVFPAQNATANVSKSTLRVMQEEFERARDICKRINEGKAAWPELFDQYDVFNTYANFLQVTATAPSSVPIAEGSEEMKPTKAYYDMWKGYCEANLRAVVTYIERFPDAYIERAHPFQKNFGPMQANEDAPYEHVWYIGLKFDRDKLKADGKKAPNVSEPVKAFKNRLLAWKEKKDLPATVKKGLLLQIKSLRKKDLPDHVTAADNAAEDLKEESIEQQLQTAQQKTAADEGVEEGAVTGGEVMGKRGGEDGREEQAPVKRMKTESQGSGADSGDAEKQVQPVAAEIKAESQVKKEPAGSVEATSETLVVADTGGDPLSEGNKAAASSVTAELLAGLKRKSPTIECDTGKTSAASVRKEVFVLEPGEELRLEIDHRAVNVTVETGFAEVFGAEIPCGESRKLVKTKMALFSWKGATVSVHGEPKGVYKSEMKEMKTYANLHAYLQQCRREARDGDAARARGPRILVVGPPSTGKSSLVRVLLNYAVREGERPLLVDLDVSKTRHSFIAGALGACAVNEVIGVESDPLVESRGQLAYYYGFRDAVKSPDLFKTLVDDMAARMQDREDSGRDTFGASSGVVIDCFGYDAASKDSYSLVASSARALQADVIVVMDVDKLLSDLQREFAGDSQVQIIKLNKCGGVVAHDKTFQAAIEKELVQDYFYGSERELCPRPLVLGFEQVVVAAVFYAPFAVFTLLVLCITVPRAVWSVHVYLVCHIT